MAKPKASEISSDQPFCPAMKELIALRFGALWQAVPVAIEGADPEGVHDVRVASRRLRAAMDVAVQCFSAEWYRPLHAIAKEITTALGEVRDRDVLLEALRRERDAAPPEEWPGVDRLIERVERERETAREEMLAFLGELETRDIARESVRRFGSAANAPGLCAKGSGG